MCDEAGNVGDPDSNPGSLQTFYLSNQPTLTSIIPFRYDSVMLWTASWDVYDRSVLIHKTNGSTIHFRAADNTSTALRVGTTRKDNYLVELLDGDQRPSPRQTAYLKLVWDDGSSQIFDMRLEGSSYGRVISIITKAGATITAEQYRSQRQISYNAAGEIESIWTKGEGLKQIERTATALAIRQYTPDQIVTDLYGKRSGTGQPWKTWHYAASYSGDAVITDITHQRRGQQPERAQRRKQNNILTILKGEGEDQIKTTYTRRHLPDSRWEQIKTVQYANSDQIAESTRTVKKYTPGGWLTESITEAYGTPQALTTLYTYNDQYRVSLATRSYGWYAQYEYDDKGRVAKETTPWGNGGFEKIREIVYADLRFNDMRPLKIIEKIIGGLESVNCSRIEYQYEDSPKTARVITRQSAVINKEEDGVWTSITEHYGLTTTNPYARGRIKYEQDIHGLARSTTYETTNLYYSKWRTVTETFDAINGQGAIEETEISYIAENGTITHWERYAGSLNEGQLISSEDYQYDPDKNTTRIKRGNGRVSTTEWMCCGPLKEIDEDGIITDYSYNSSRQLIETIRSATPTCPETIVSYTYDAKNRVLGIRTDTGPMSTIASTVWDARGRMVSQTDEAGRETAYTFSSELKNSVTLATGEIIVQEFNIDGSLACEADSLQRIYYDYQPSHYGYTIDEYLDQNFNRLRRSVRYMSTGEILKVEMTAIQDDSTFTSEEYGYSPYAALAYAVNRGVKTIYSHDAWGRKIEEFILQRDKPGDNDLKTKWTYNYIRLLDGVYRRSISTTSGEGLELISTEDNLISELHPKIEQKTIETDIYGEVATSWTEYGSGSERSINQVLTSTKITAVTKIIDGFTVSRIDSNGLTHQYAITYTSKGTVITTTDARGNTTTEKANLVGWITEYTDAAGATIQCKYDTITGQPWIITDALGNTAIYLYDTHGRKIAEYGTGIQPALFTYDGDGNLTSLTTFRIRDEIIANNPIGRDDGDITRWEYAWQEPLLKVKTYADGRYETTQYDSYNRIASTINARGISTRYTYDNWTGLTTGINYSDATPNIDYQYNGMLQLAVIHDSQGVHTIKYDRYANPYLSINAAGSLILGVQELYDTFGRSAGYQIKKGAKDASAEEVVYTARIAYADNGQLHHTIGDGKAYARYHYQPGTGLLSKLEYSNKISRHIQYEERRDLVVNISYQEKAKLQFVQGVQHLNPRSVKILGVEIQPNLVTRTQDNDQLGRPVARTLQRNDQAPSHDTYSYNQRSELIGTTHNATFYTYRYDNIGNREQAAEASAPGTRYTTNSLNQYTSLECIGSPGKSGDFTPQYDRDGNQTLIKTSTGIWRADYNAVNRPVRFTSEDGRTIIECDYDYMGRRWYKKTTQSGVIRLHQEYLYRGYLQIAAFDLLDEESLLYATLWDPSEPIATRPLILHVNGQNYYYGWDFNKNVTELFDNDGKQIAQYDYNPLGGLINPPNNDIGKTNTFRFSSEYYDEELGLIYYSYRHYNPIDGRWISREPLEESEDPNLYRFIRNYITWATDYLGLGLTTMDNPTGAAVAREYARMTVRNTSRQAARNTARRNTDNLPKGQNNKGNNTPRNPAKKPDNKPQKNNKNKDNKENKEKNKDKDQKDKKKDEKEKREKDKKREQWKRKCEEAYNAYKKYNCTRCSGSCTCTELYSKVACFYGYLTARYKYVNMKCDYVLEGSSSNPEGKEKSHLDEIESVINAINNCNFWIEKKCSR